MSEPKIISPLLDGFTLGAPISEHHGVVCCPAIKENTNKKYIVKILSVPATQAQFDALLLAGAYKDPAAVMEYFREKGDRIAAEAETLKTLSRIEGFLPYEGWQMEPITRRRLGYQVYLVGSYKRSLEKYMRKHAFTHREATELALDLCSALSVCRQSGFLYADLKPSNIYVSEKKEYRIGDLGFLSLDSLRYASLPERYFSPYTPPELLDPMTAMNLTADTYALGMILYQLYNDGHLPFTGTAPKEPLPNPCHADYEMAEIIMKAIHPDPQQRWTDPRDLGKAIGAYTQRNPAEDLPITHFLPLDAVAEPVTEAVSTPEEAPETPDPEPVAEETSIDPDSVETENLSAETELQEDPSEEVCQESIELTEETPSQEAEEMSLSAEHAEELSLEEESEVIPKKTIAEQEEAQAEPEEILEEAEYIPEYLPAPEDQPAPLPEEPEPTAAENLQLSDEVVKILSRADDLIAHEIPGETAFPVEPEQPDPFAFALEEPEEIPEDFTMEPLILEKAQQTGTEKKKKGKHFEDPSRKKKLRRFLSGCCALVLLGGGSVGGYWYYENEYLQTVDAMTITGTQDQITVLVDTGVEESRLTVHCTDPKGSRKSEAVLGGKVTFTGLEPSTEYVIEVDMQGLHKLTGEAAAVFTTHAPTQILSFRAVAGAEDGSVLLDFTVEGNEPDFWNIRYFAEGEEEKTETVNRHSASITGLTVGKVYTFTLDGSKDFDLSGETSVQFLASRLILANDLTVSSDNGTDITVQWKTPGDVVVESWDVRFFDGYGFEEQLTVTENNAAFTGLDPASHYTLEVTAAGMTQPSVLEISADPILVSNFQIKENPKKGMEISWDTANAVPEGGWLLAYTVDGSGAQEIPCEKASAVIEDFIPGANYAFTLRAADGQTVFNNTTLYRTMDAETFTEHNFPVKTAAFDLLKTPETSGWHFEDLTEDVFTDTFRLGEPASLVIRSKDAFYLPGNQTSVMFVFRDSYGNVLPDLTGRFTCSWKSIWQAGDSKTGELDIPRLPYTPGEYAMELYFNGALAAQFDITVTE